MARIPKKYQKHLKPKRRKLEGCDTDNAEDSDSAIMAFDIDGNIIFNDISSNPYNTYSKNIYKMSISDLEKVLSQAKKENKSQLIGMISEQLGIILAKEGRNIEAKTYFENSLKIFECLGLKSLQANVLDNLGSVISSLGNYDKSIEIYNSAIALLDNIDDEINLSKTIGNRGTVYHLMGDYARALKDFEIAADLAKKYNDTTEVGYILSDIANTLESLGQFDEALEKQQEALKIAESDNDDYRRGVVLNYIGHIYLGMEKVDEALIYELKALKILQEIRNEYWEEQTHNALAAIYRKLNRFDDAIRELNESIKIGLKLNDIYGIGTNYTYLGQCYCKLGDFSNGIIWLSKSLEFSEKLKSVQNSAGILREMGICFLALENPIKSYDCYLKSLQKYNQLLKGLEGTKYHLKFKDTFRKLPSLIENLRDLIYTHFFMNTPAELKEITGDAVKICKSLKKVEEVEKFIPEIGKNPEIIRELIKISKLREDIDNLLESFNDILLTGFDSTDNVVRAKLREINFRDYIDILSTEQGKNWFKLIRYLLRLLHSSYESEILFRLMSSSIKEDDFREKLYTQLLIDFGPNVSSKPGIAGGHMDIRIFQIPLEVKLIKGSNLCTKVNIEDFKKRVINTSINQLLVECGHIGLGFLIVCDNRIKIRSKKIIPSVIHDCFSFVSSETRLVGVFIIQMFQGTPSDF